jgi:hypothetical protein
MKTYAGGSPFAVEKLLLAVLWMSIGGVLVIWLMPKPMVSRRDCGPDRHVEIVLDGNAYTIQCAPGALPREHPETRT